MLIVTAEENDLEEILALQRLAYQSEARLLNNASIPPLTQTLEDMRKEFRKRKAASSDRCAASPAMGRSSSAS